MSIRRRFSAKSWHLRRDFSGLGTGFGFLLSDGRGSRGANEASRSSGVSLWPWFAVITFGCDDMISTYTHQYVHFARIGPVRPRAPPRACELEESQEYSGWDFGAARGVELTALGAGRALSGSWHELFDDCRLVGGHGGPKRNSALFGHDKFFFGWGSTPPAPVFGPYCGGLY